MQIQRMADIADRAESPGKREHGGTPLGRMSTVLAGVVATVGAGLVNARLAGISFPSRCYPAWLHCASPCQYPECTLALRPW